MSEGSIVDTMLIAAPPSTKNKDGKRDRGMHQSKKINDYYFDTNRNVFVDCSSGLVHTVLGMSGSVSDVSQAQALVYDNESHINLVGDPD